MGIKITLDSNALERLIGGDSEIEIELRSAIVASFSKKYLKDVVASDAFRKASMDVKKAVVNEYKNQTDLISVKGDSIFLTESYKESIRQQIKDTLESTLIIEIHEVMRSFIKEYTNSKEFLDICEDTLKHFAQQHIAHFVSEKMDKIIQNEIFNMDSKQ